MYNKLVLKLKILVCFFMKEYSILDVKQYILNQLKSSNIDAYECNYLLAEVLKCNLNDLILIKSISKSQFNKIKHIVNLRKQGKPLTKIFNRAYFYGLEFYVDENVLSCRPETEILIDKIVEIVKNKDCKILDLCAGSGCIGITLSTLGFNNVMCADISKKACKIIKKNALILKQNVKIMQSDLFSKINDKFDVIVSNPPYIKSEDIDKLDKEVKNYDPRISLDGGEDGLYFYNKIILNLNKFLYDDGIILFEIGYDQAGDVCNLLKNAGFNAIVIKDYSNNDRVIIARR